MAATTLHFQVPELSDNPEGWGPTTLPEQYKDIPYAPFNKSDKIGKASDWTGQAYKYGGRFDRDRSGGIVNAAFSFFHNEDEDSFHLVDTKPIPRPKFGPRRFQPNRFQQQRGRDDARRDMGGRDSGAGADRERQRRERMQQQKRGQRNTFYADKNVPRIVYNSSVDIRSEWVVLEQIPFTSLTKLNYDAGSPEDVLSCGALHYYDKSFDRVTPKLERQLERSNRHVAKLTTSEDPIIKRLSNENAANVFVTDTILSTLMCATRSVYSWDVVVHKTGDKLFFDQRNTSFDLLTVNETAAPMEAVPEESINSLHSLSQEATFINKNFIKQVLQKNGNKHSFSDPSPFASSGDTSAYRYRRWKLDQDTNLIVRCTLDCVMEVRNQEVFAAVHSLNEFDPKITGVDWRQKIENQRGAVLATELKNNANKLAKWTAQALLSGAEMMKLGFVSRAHPRDNHNHVILTVQSFKPKEFAAQITLGIGNLWGIFKSLVDICSKLDDGKYLFVKDPNKPIIRLYKVPTDAFSNDYAEEAIPQTDASDSNLETKNELSQE